MYKVITLTLLTMFSLSSLADAPLPAPASSKVCALGGAYCADLKPGQDTIVYRVENNAEHKEIYRIKGWHRSFHLSPNGEYVVLGYPGGNLVSQQLIPSPTMLSIYHKGLFQHTVKLSELLKNIDSLKKTVSHYHWGYIGPMSDEDIMLCTVEGLVTVYLESGKVAFDKSGTKLCN